MAVIVAATCAAPGVAGGASAAPALVPPCVARGPAWSFTAPSPSGGGSTVVHGRTYAVGPQTYLGCAKEKAALVRIFARWPRAARPGAALSGGPAGWACVVSGPRHSGQCRRGARAFFEWAPVVIASP